MIKLITEFKGVIMKKYIYPLLLICICLFLFTSCSEGTTDGGVTEILQISSSTLDLNVGHVQKLTVKTNLNASPAVSWTSTNPAVASVDSNGVVTANEIGAAVIIARLESGLEKYCVVNVVPRAYTFEELVNFNVKDLPLTVRSYDKETGELITECVISSFVLNTPKYGSNFAVYITLEGVKTYDRDGDAATNPIFISTSLYREKGENCDINNYCENNVTRVGENFTVTLPPFEVLLNFEKARELELRILAEIYQ